MKYTEDDLREDLKNKEYEAGFYTDIEYEDFPAGLNEDIIRAISAKKEEPEWMTEWRLESFRIWQKWKNLIGRTLNTKNQIFKHKILCRSKEKTRIRKLR
ncbi:iron-sulfur cluster assembly protein SufB [Bergeyella porcorum]|uniref:Iron-sulfur cluster assembly protein SufB n=1 Tax=Bergeyella porcorum TaxID=1735111 RepID=A0AAU0EZU8_9FLAO